jgi:uncharacterized protein (DUF2336 family)
MPPIFEGDFHRRSRVTTTRANLNEIDLRRLVRGDTVEDRAAAAEKLCGAVERIAITEQDRIAAQNVLRLIAEDAAVMVRRAVSTTLKCSTLLPRDAALKLARDVEEVATPVIGFSPVFTDEDLIEILEYASAEKQVALAGRPRLTERVTGVICERGVEAAVAAVCANDNAAFDETALERALERFPASAPVTGAMAKREYLPLKVCEKLAELVEGELRTQLIERHDLKPEAAKMLSTAARERITVDLVDQAAASSDLAGFAAHLNQRQRLTPSLLLRALARGQMPFFEHALSELAYLPHSRTWLMVHDAGPLGFKALYERAGLPSRLYQAFKAGVDAWRSLQQENSAADAYVFQERMIERFLTSQPFAAKEDLDYLLDKLDRRRDELRPVHANAA